MTCVGLDDVGLPASLPESAFLIPRAGLSMLREVQSWLIFKGVQCRNRIQWVDSPNHSTRESCNNQSQRGWQDFLHISHRCNAASWVLVPSFRRMFLFAAGLRPPRECLRSILQPWSNRTLSVVYELGFWAAASIPTDKEQGDGWQGLHQADEG